MLLASYNLTFPLTPAASLNNPARTITKIICQAISIAPHRCIPISFRVISVPRFLVTILLRLKGTLHLFLVPIGLTSPLWPFEVRFTINARPEVSTRGVIRRIFNPFDFSIFNTRFSRISVR